MTENGSFYITVLPQIVVHAPMYETEGLVHAPKVSPKCTFFLPQKNRAVSYISACTCRDPRFCYLCKTIFTLKRPILTLKHAFFRGFQTETSIQAKLTLIGVSYISACSTIRNRQGCTYIRSRFFTLKNRVVSYISACTTICGNTVVSYTFFFKFSIRKLGL